MALYKVWRHVEGQPWIVSIKKCFERNCCVLVQFIVLGLNSFTKEYRETYDRVINLPAENRASEVSNMKHKQYSRKMDLWWCGSWVRAAVVCYFTGLHRTGRSLPVVMVELISPLHQSGGFDLQTAPELHSVACCQNYSFHWRCFLSVEVYLNVFCQMILKW